MKPPLLSRTILWLCLPASDRESIPGDLFEEFNSLGDDAGRCNLRQAFRSAMPALGTRWWRGEIQECFTLALILLASPFVLVLGIGRFVVCQVLLKAEVLRPSFCVPVSLGSAHCAYCSDGLRKKLLEGKAEVATLWCVHTCRFNCARGACAVCPGTTGRRRPACRFD